MGAGVRLTADAASLASQQMGYLAARLVLGVEVASPADWISQRVRAPPQWRAWLDTVILHPLSVAWALLEPPCETVPPASQTPPSPAAKPPTQLAAQSKVRPWLVWMVKVLGVAVVGCFFVVGVFHARLAVSGIKQQRFINGLRSQLHMCEMDLTAAKHAPPVNNAHTLVHRLSGSLEEGRAQLARCEERARGLMAQSEAYHGDSQACTNEMRRRAAEHREELYKRGANCKYAMQQAEEQYKAKIREAVDNGVKALQEGRKLLWMHTARARADAQSLAQCEERTQALVTKVRIAQEDGQACANELRRTHESCAEECASALHTCKADLLTARVTPTKQETVCATQLNAYGVRMAAARRELEQCTAKNNALTQCEAERTAHGLGLQTCQLEKAATMARTNELAERLDACQQQASSATAQRKHCEAALHDALDYDRRRRRHHNHRQH